MLNSEQLWPVFLENAMLYHQKFEIFVSPKEKSPYRISAVQPNKVSIQRLSSDTGEKVTRRKFATAIRRLNAFYPRIPKNTLYDHVVEETAIVELLPNLDWDEHHDFIIAGPYAEPQPGTNPPGQRGTRYTEVEIRLGQPKLREKLLYLYEGKCAISGVEIKPVLHACHITPYRQSKVCLAEDSILLRSDLHDLFDADLLAIHPETFQVHIHRLVQRGDYQKFHHNGIRPRLDGGSILPSGLRSRWEAFQNKTTLT